MSDFLNLDSLDRRILVALQADGGLTNPELAEKVGSTPPSCWRRVRQLEQAGILGQTVRLADRKALHQAVTVMCHVRLRNHERATVEGFEAFVREEPRIMECFSMSGEWDYVLQIVAGDVEEYEAFLMHRVLRHGGVGNASSHFAMRTIKYQTALPVRGAG